MKKRPHCEMVDVSLDIDKMIRIARETLVKEGMHEEAEQFMQEVNQAKSMTRVFGAINRYVDTNSDLLEHFKGKKQEKE